MTTDITTALDLAERAYKLAIDEFWDNRKNRREYEGAMPKRKHPAWRIFDRVRKKMKSHIATPDLRTLKIIAAAYDKGLGDRHDELYRQEYLKGDTYGRTDMRTQSP